MNTSGRLEAVSIAYYDHAKKYHIWEATRTHPHTTSFVTRLTHSHSCTAVDPSVGAKRVIHEILLMTMLMTMETTGLFINCEDGLQIPW